MLGQQGSRGLGARNITLIAALLSAFVFGSTAWGQAAELPGGARVVFTACFVLAGFGAPWLIYGIAKLLGKLFRIGKGS